jgi:hypothetical protein
MWRRTLPLLAGLAAMGCTGESTAEGQASTVTDAAGDDAVDAAPPYDGAVCCQVTVNFTADPYWQNCRYGCFPDAAVSPATVPWVCNLDKPTSCGDPTCVVGSTCQGFNGTGVVLPCDAGVTAARGHQPSLCP